VVLLIAVMKVRPRHGWPRVNGASHCCGQSRTTDPQSDIDRILLCCNDSDGDLTSGNVSSRLPSTRLIRNRAVGRPLCLPGHRVRAMLWARRASVSQPGTHLVSVGERGEAFVACDPEQGGSEFPCC
jgi:hypothetical protein